MVIHSPLSSSSTLFQNLLNVASAPVYACGSHEDNNICKDLRFVAVTGELPSGATANANLRDGHMNRWAQRRVNVRACGDLRLYIESRVRKVLGQKRAVTAGITPPVR